jgi:hypothetical protein
MGMSAVSYKHSAPPELETPLWPKAALSLASNYWGKSLPQRRRPRRVFKEL